METLVNMPQQNGVLLVEIRMVLDFESVCFLCVCGSDTYTYTPK